MVEGLGFNELVFADDKDGFSASAGEFQNPMHGSNTLPIFRELDVTSFEKIRPLGLTLNKTPSFLNSLDLLEMKLSKPNTPSASSSTEKHHASVRDARRAKMDDFVSQPMSEKLKASNFPALLLKIGSWERVSRHEGDLIAKCYYAKKKIVWEVLEGALKSKIEIQWSDIEAIRATIRDDQPGILEIELSQQPLFFRETNPQPRKHTLWQTASDFTGGQAPICRRHYVKFPPGTLDKHYEKLLQCDHRLFELSQRPFPRLQSPYFYSNTFGVTDIAFDFNACQSQAPPGLRYSLPSIPSSSLVPRNLKLSTRKTIVDSNSPMSVMDFPRRNENVGNYTRAAHWGQGDRIQYLPQSITSATQANAAFSCQGYHQPAYGGEARSPNANSGILKDLENHLLGDSQVVCTDEKMLRAMSSLLDPLEEANPEHNIVTNHYEHNQEKCGDDNPILGSPEDHFEVNGGLFYPQPIQCLPAQVSHEKVMMHHLGRDDYQFVFPDPKMDYDEMDYDDDYAAVDAGHGVRQWR